MRARDLPFRTATSASSATLSPSLPPSTTSTPSSTPSLPGACEPLSQSVRPGSWYSTLRSAVRRSPVTFLNFSSGKATKSCADGFAIV